MVPEPKRDEWCQAAGVLLSVISSVRVLEQTIAAILKIHMVPSFFEVCHILYVVALSAVGSETLNNGNIRQSNVNGKKKSALLGKNKRDIFCHRAISSSPYSHT